MCISGAKRLLIGADTWQLLDSIMIEAAKSQLPAGG